MANPTSSSSLRTLRLQALIGAAGVVLTFGGLLLWGSFTQIAGAVISPGLVAVDGGSKKVQHQEGGTVARIYVQNNDHVEAGQLLISLDDTTAKATLDIVVSQLLENLAREARLESEVSAQSILKSPAVADLWARDLRLAKLLAAEDRLRSSRADAVQQKRAAIDQEIAGLKQQSAAQTAQRKSVIAQLEIAKEELNGLQSLFDRGVIDKGKLNTFKRQVAELEGSAASLAATIAALKTDVAQREQAKLLTQTEFESDALTQLQQVRQQVAELTQQKIAAEDRLRRLEIRSPDAGTVHESIVHTIGGVVSPGQTLMMVVPNPSVLVVDSRVSPLDIDKLAVGQQALVRVTGFDSRTTPDLSGKIASISPDLVQDERTGQQYYAARIQLPEAEVNKLPSGARMVAGMPTETFILTGDRTVLAYLLQPLEAQLVRVFREN